MTRFRPHLALGPESAPRGDGDVLALAALEGRVELGAAPAVPIPRTHADVVARPVQTITAIFAANSVAFVLFVYFASVACF